MKSVFQQVMHRKEGTAWVTGAIDLTPHLNLPRQYSYPFNSPEGVDRNLIYEMAGSGLIISPTHYNIVRVALQKTAALF